MKNTILILFVFIFNGMFGQSDTTTKQHIDTSKVNMIIMPDTNKQVIKKDTAEIKIMIIPELNQMIIQTRKDEDD